MSETTPWDDRAIAEVVIALRTGDTLTNQAKEDIADLINHLQEKRPPDDEHLWRFWNEKARKLSAENSILRRESAKDMDAAVAAAVTAFQEETGGFGASDDEKVVRKVIAAYVYASQVGGK